MWLLFLDAQSKSHWRPPVSPFYSESKRSLILWQWLLSVPLSVLASVPPVFPTHCTSGSGGTFVCLVFVSFPNLFKFIYLNIFNWRIIALQYYIGFCHISTWINHRYTCVPSLLNLPPWTNFKANLPDAHVVRDVIFISFSTVCMSAWH